MVLKINRGFFLCLVLLCPFIAQAQSADIDQLHTVLEKLYKEMLPLCSQLIRVAQCIAAFGALFYIGYRIWKSIATAEPIDFFPLLRPFVLSIAIGIFPQVIQLMNGLLSPVVSVTNGMVKSAHRDVEKLLIAREQSDIDNAATFTPPGTAALNSLSGTGTVWSNLIRGNYMQLFRMFLASVLELLYYAASLCIDCMRTFHLLILAILGPLVFAIAVYDGFHHTLSIWIGRYINIYLWLPIANLFGALITRIQASMITADIVALQTGQKAGFLQTDLPYLIFLVIGIIGYFSIPSIANYVVHASGGSAIMSKTNSLISSQLSSILKATTGSGSTGGAGSFGGSSSGNAAGSMSANVPGDDRMSSPMSDAANSNAYQNSKISGKPTATSGSGNVASDAQEGKVYGQ